MLFQAYLFCLLSIGHTSTASPDIVAAITGISQAIDAGRNLATELKAHVEIEEARLSKLRRLIERLDTALETTGDYNTSEKNQSNGLVTREETTTNPVSAFLAIQRLASNWSSELSTILEVPNVDSNDAEGLVLDIKEGSKEFDSRMRLFIRLKWYADMLPDESDVQGAMDAVFRLQQTYNISSLDIAEGKVLPSSTSPRLTDQQCMQFGQLSYGMGDYSHAIEWYLVVLDRIDAKRRTGKSEDENDVISYVTLYDYLSYALGRSGRYKAALEITKKLLNEDPTSQNGLRSIAFYETELDRLKGNDPPHIDDESERTESSEAYVFEDLCRQADKWVPPNSNLSCRYSTPHPYFKLAPLKEEILYEDPLILLFHDFVTQNEVGQIIALAKPKLKRALVRNPVTGRLETSTYRVTKNAWLRDNLNNLTKRLNSRIRMATGLNTAHGEELQVANYGLGGFYAPHFDYSRRFELDNYEKYHGNRIATTMVYLTPVELGGGTAFTKMGLVVKPVARSMVFWYNLLRSGEGDLRSRHGACPVLAGSKWVMNKWIRAAGQEFTRPCGLESEPFNPEDEYLDF